MKTKVFLAAILVLGVLFTSCEKEEFKVIPSEKVTTSNLSVSGIKSIDVSSLYHVFVSFSETEESVFIEANENLHSLIRARQDGGRLVVGLARNTGFIGDPVLNLYVKTASLEKVIAEGAVKVEFENLLVNNQLQIDLSGACHFKGSVDTGSFAAKVDGASKLEMDGSSDSFQIDATGASQMTGFDFITGQLYADLVGGSKISLTVQQKLNVNARGGSKVYYKGNGVIENQKLKDASEIIKID